MWFGICLFGTVTIAYILLMIYFPEWVGITGKTALKNQQSHRGEGEKPAEKSADSQEKPKN